MEAIKGAIQQLCNVVGYEVRKTGRPTRSFAEGVGRLEALASPRTVIDIGVAQGTPDLYRFFPEAQFLLVEANPQFTKDLTQLAGNIDAIVEKVFCGPERGEVKLNVYADPRKSSAYEWREQRDKEREINVPVEMLDALVSKHNLQPPYLVKVDVEGSEIDVIRGATKTLQESSAVIMETSIVPKFQGGPELADVVCFMAERGFSVFDIISAVDHKKSGNLYQVDLVFVDSSSGLRTHSG